MEHIAGGDELLCSQACGCTRAKRPVHFLDHTMDEIPQMQTRFTLHWYKQMWMPTEGNCSKEHDSARALRTISAWLQNYNSNTKRISPEAEKLNKPSSLVHTSTSVVPHRLFLPPGHLPQKNCPRQSIQGQNLRINSHSQLLFITFVTVPLTKKA